MGFTRKQLLMLGVLISGSFITILNQTLVTPALPTIMGEMSIDASTVQWLTTGFTLVNAIMIPITAYLTDRFSTRKIFITAMFLFLAGTILCAWGPNFILLLAGRLIQAVGAGVMMPVVMTVMLLTFPAERRGSAMGWFGIIVGLAPSIGPTLAGVLIDHLSWHVMFVIVAVLALVIIALAAIVLEKDGDNKDVQALDKISVLLSTFGFGLLLYGFSSIGSYGPSLMAFLPIVAGAIVLVLFFRRQLSQEAPMLQVKVLKSRRFTISTIVTMTVQAAIMSNAVLIPIFVQNLCGQTATTSGLVMLPGALIMGIMSPIAGKYFDKHGPRKMAIFGTVLMTLTTFCMCFLDVGISMVLFCCIIAVRNFAMSIINMPINTWGINSLNNSLINHGNAIGNTFRMVAGSLGTAIVVSVYSLVSAANSSLGSIEAGVAGVNAAFAAQAILFIAATTLTIVFVRDKEHDPLTSDPENERKSLVEAIMHRDVYSLPITATVADAVRLFTEKGISAAPVVDDDGEVTGFVSDGDVMRALGQRSSTYVDPVTLMMSSSMVDGDALHKFDAVMNRKVTSICTAGVITVDIHAGIEEICRVLGSNHLKKIPITENGHIVGIINRSDITMYSMNLYLQRRSQLEIESK
jgi:MFS transporter, DHA2 family, multidrug resistance protein